MQEKKNFIVDSVVTYTLSIGSVGNADRMNQRYEGSLWAFLGVSTPQNRTYRAWGRDGSQERFEAFNGPAQEPVRLETEPTGPGVETVIFLKGGWRFYRHTAPTGLRIGASRFIFL